ncbi:hypothetical protein ACFSCX_19830 [Bacillus salitolerans]|uniref:Uncharacterized protein n=1 Tax=Bacillus salitolerans TaxID=1437434 RepID=A0ABW4LV50_9BACI
MENRLQKLKESMNDHVFTDIYMDKKLKGKILKNVSKHNKGRTIIGKKWNIQIVTASLVSLCLLFIILFNN